MSNSWITTEAWIGRPFKSLFQVKFQNMKSFQNKKINLRLPVEVDFWIFFFFFTRTAFWMTYLFVLYKFSLTFFEQPIVLALYHAVTWEAEEKETKKAWFPQIFGLLRSVEVLERPSHEYLFWNLEQSHWRIIHTTTQTNHEGLAI